MKPEKIRLSFLLFIFTLSCTEPFEPQTSKAFESALVVDATFTNELKKQELYLSRAYTFDSIIKWERGASVLISDDMGNKISFKESNPGTYLSVSAFAAQPGREYKLEIKTNKGRKYISDAERLPSITEIDTLIAQKITTDLGIEGIGIFVSSSNLDNNSKNYKYEYEETFKIVAPFWTPQDLIGDPNVGCGVLVVPSAREEMTCYRTDFSTDIILTNTNGLFKDNIKNFLVRFIDRKNYIISYRYSILVKQYVLSDKAYTFFETLKKFSVSESIFSESQPGYLGANITSMENRSEKVLGYFSVVSVSEKRIYYNYEDFYPNEALPPYINPCIVTVPILRNPGGCILLELVENNLVRYLGDNPSENESLMQGPFKVVPRVCGDCTAIGSLEAPEFWIEN